MFWSQDYTSSWRCVGGQVCVRHCSESLLDTLCRVRELSHWGNHRCWEAKHKVQTPIYLILWRNVTWILKVSLQKAGTKEKERGEGGRRMVIMDSKKRREEREMLTRSHNKGGGRERGVKNGECERMNQKDGSWSERSTNARDLFEAGTDFPPKGITQCS